MALFSELSDLDFVVFVVAQLAFVVFDFDSEGFNFDRQSFDFDGLENDDKVEFS